MRISDWSSDVCSSDLCCGGKIGKADRAENAARAQLLARSVVHIDLQGDETSPLLGRGKTQWSASPAETQDLLEPRPLGDPGEAVDLVGEGIFDERSAERSVGKECVSTCRSRGSPNH